MKARKLIQAVKKYCNYLEDHIDNVEKAWIEVQEKCSDMWFIKNKKDFEKIDYLVKEHDLSKLTIDEFIPYVNWFYNDTADKNEKEKIKKEFDRAWKHHILNNRHHWENWVNRKYYEEEKWEWDCVCMIIDWTAMGYMFGDTAKEYYENNRNRIKIPETYIPFMYEIFKKIESS